MKQMTLIEMDGFLKGKCIPRDLKVNETNAEYLVRKFGELESKLETALRECRSAGITIDNLEARCAALTEENALLDELDKWKQESSAWQAVAEKQLALATNAEQKISELEAAGIITKVGSRDMAELTKQRIIEYLKASTQNASGMFEISEDTICALMSMLTATPSPVVPDEMTPKQASRSYCGEVRGYRDGWNACRASMLKGAEPVTTAYKSPDDFICMLTGRAKYLREKGEIKSPELLERAAAALQGESVNAPSIPNGWKLVPIDPTKDMLRAGQSVVGFWLNTVHCYSKMLAAAPAAPQQGDL